MHKVLAIKQRCYNFIHYSRENQSIRNAHKTGSAQSDIKLVMGPDTVAPVLQELRKNLHSDSESRIQLDSTLDSYTTAVMEEDWDSLYGLRRAIFDEIQVLCRQAVSPLSSPFVTIYSTQVVIGWAKLRAE